MHENVQAWGLPPAPEIERAVGKSTTVTVEDFRPMLKNTLRGFARVRFASGLIVSEISVHVANGKAWASPPSRPMVDTRTGFALRDRDGKMRYQPLITFASKELRDRWSMQVVDAVRAAYPDALVDAVDERAA